MRNIFRQRKNKKILSLCQEIFLIFSVSTFCSLDNIFTVKPYQTELIDFRINKSKSHEQRDILNNRKENGMKNETIFEFYTST